VSCQLTEGGRCCAGASSPLAPRGPRAPPCRPPAAVLEYAASTMAAPMKTAHFVTFGCKVNQYEARRPPSRSRWRSPSRSGPSEGPDPFEASFRRVLLRAQEVEGHVRPVAHDPAVVRQRWDVEELSRPELDAPPSSNDTAAVPERTRPTCSTTQHCAPTDGPTCSDHLHPGRSWRTRWSGRRGGRSRTSPSSWPGSRRATRTV